jgi:D-alanine--poly(phosphoribitol) ligase subunit 2
VINEVRNMHNPQEILSVLERVKPGCTVAPDAELIHSGKLDSVEVMSLAMELAMEFGVEMSPLELKEENFSSVNAITAMVNRLEDEG